MAAGCPIPFLSLLIISRFLLTSSLDPPYPAEIFGMKTHYPPPPSLWRPISLPNLRFHGVHKIFSIIRLQRQLEVATIIVMVNRDPQKTAIFGQKSGILTPFQPKKRGFERRFVSSLSQKGRVENGSPILPRRESGSLLNPAEEVHRNPIERHLPGSLVEEFGLHLSLNEQLLDRCLPWN